MPYYIRKIDKAQWSRKVAGGGEACADAITNDLYTRKDALSFWKVDDLNQESIEEVIVAIASSFTSGVDTFDVIVLEDKEIDGFITSIQTDSPTPYIIMAQKHYDLVELTLSKLVHLGSIIHPKVHTTDVKRFTKGHIKNLLRAAVAADNSYVERLHPTISGSL